MFGCSAGVKKDWMMPFLNAVCFKEMLLDLEIRVTHDINSIKKNNSHWKKGVIK